MKRNYGNTNRIAHRRNVYRNSRWTLDESVI